MYRNQWLWGFSLGAETWNGRLAMVSFVVIYLLELLLSVSVLRFLGIY